MSKLRRYIDRHRLRVRKSFWRLSNSFAPNARPVFILGVQRSGTTLLLHCLNQSLEIEMFGEMSKAMVGFRIVDDKKLKKIITSSRHKIVLLKPLADSHRAQDFLNLTPNCVAIWAFRKAADRANSSVVRFGDHNLRILSGFKEGKFLDRWQAQGLSAENMEIIRSFDFNDMTPHSASGLFWYIRNSLFFEYGLDDASNVLPLAYEDLVLNPSRVIAGVCKFIGSDYHKQMVKGVHNRSIEKERSSLSDQIDSLCEELYDRMYEAQVHRWRELRL